MPIPPFTASRKELNAFLHRLPAQQEAFDRLDRQGTLSRRMCLTP
jgi:hypothetical protein